MNTILDNYDDLLLAHLGYDGTTLNVCVKTILGGVEVSEIQLLFDSPINFYVIEEANDAIIYQGRQELEQPGFLKVFPQKGDPMETMLSLTWLAPNADLNHFRLITRDEIVHVVSSTQPRFV